MVQWCNGASRCGETASVAGDMRQTRLQLQAAFGLRDLGFGIHGQDSRELMQKLHLELTCQPIVGAELSLQGAPGITVGRRR